MRVADGGVGISSRAYFSRLDDHLWPFVSVNFNVNVTKGNVRNGAQSRR